MGAAQSFNSPFLQHGGPRGPSVPSSMNPASVGGLMGPSGMSPMGMNPTRTASMAPLYTGQRLPQHGYPGPPQAQPLPRQGVKRAYATEVSVQGRASARVTENRARWGRCCPSLMPVPPLDVCLVPLSGVPRAAVPARRPVRSWPRAAPCPLLLPCSQVTPAHLRPPGTALQGRASSSAATWGGAHMCSVTEQPGASPRS